MDNLEGNSSSAAVDERSDASPTHNPADQASSDGYCDPIITEGRSFWSGLDGLMITLFGVALPGCLFVAGCLSAPKRLTLVFLSHPLETLAELLMLILIPVMNYFIWSKFCQRKAIFFSKSIIALGAAIGTSLVLASISIAALFFSRRELASQIGTNFSTGFMWIAILSLLSAGTSAFLANRIRLALELRQSRRKVVILSTIGVMLPALIFAAAELRPWRIRHAEQMAVSASIKERDEGLSLLRQLNPERELRMECSDQRAAGLAGLFIPIKKGTLVQLYFAVTGKPFSFTDDSNPDLASMPDDYLSRHVVGDKIAGLVLTRSQLSGNIHPDTLSTTLNWTLVFKNETSVGQEARAEIGLPPGAAITGITAWDKGEPKDARIVASGKVDGVQTVSVGRDSQAMVTDLGHGRVLVNCYQVPEEAELKMRVSMVVPLKPDTAKTATLATPRLIASNFSLAGEHQFRFRSPRSLTSNLTKPTSNNITKQPSVIAGVFSESQLNDANFVVTAERQASQKPIAILDKLAVQLLKEDLRHKEELRKASAKRTTASNGIGEVVVMIDGSKGVEQQLAGIHKALEFKNHAGGPTARARISTIEPRYLMQNIDQIASMPPKHLVVVIDGSITTKDYIKELSTALKKLPSNIRLSVMLAAQEKEELFQATGDGGDVTVRKILDQIRDVQYVGGQDNLKAIVKAAEMAGDTRGGAVLWIHGPQPAINQEIYIMAPYLAPPEFYELQLGAGTDTTEFFKNHTEIGPFVQVPRHTASVADDLGRFFSKWQPNSNDYTARLTEVSSQPVDSMSPSPDEARELLALYAKQETEHLLSLRHPRKAAIIAVNYGIVSPVSTAVVVPNDHNLNEPDESRNDSENDHSQILPGTVNSTGDAQTGDAFVAQDIDATAVHGVSTAGTVRVNNIANLEALLNIIANAGEILAIILGLVMIVSGLRPMLLGETIQLGTIRKVMIGCAVAFIGLALPGAINWLVASARDANLFS